MPCRYGSTGGRPGRVSLMVVSAQASNRMSVAGRMRRRRGEGRLSRSVVGQLAHQLTEGERAGVVAISFR